MLSLNISVIKRSFSAVEKIYMFSNMLNQKKICFKKTKFYTNHSFKKSCSEKFLQIQRKVPAVALWFGKFPASGQQIWKKRPPSMKLLYILPNITEYFF